MSYICPVHGAASTDLLTNLQQCYIQIWLAELELALRARGHTVSYFDKRPVHLLTHLTGHTMCTSNKKREKKKRKCVNSSAVPSHDNVLLISATKGHSVHPSMCTDLL